MGGDCFQMSKFFVDKTSVDLKLNKIIITGDDVNHIRNVLRMACGDKTVISDGSGTDYHICIEGFEKDKVVTSIIDAKPNCTEPPIDITLFQGIPKSDKMDYIIQKSVELGVKTIVPVITERTVVKIDNPKEAGDKTARWRRICLEAAKQCNRGIVPSIEEPIRFNKALDILNKFSLSIIPYEKETGYSLKKCIDSFPLSLTNGLISVFIGPEGGFSEDEIRNAVNKGVRAVTLGPRILRTETAGVAVLSIIMYGLGDMGNRQESISKNQ